MINTQLLDSQITYAHVMHGCDIGKLSDGVFGMKKKNEI